MIISYITSSRWMLFPHRLPLQQGLNGHVQLCIYKQYIITTWIDPLGGLRPWMAFYSEHFLETCDGIIVRPFYMSQRWSLPSASLYCLLEQVPTRFSARRITI